MKDNRSHLAGSLSVRPTRFVARKCLLPATAFTFLSLAAASYAFGPQKNDQHKHCAHKEPKMHHVLMAKYLDLSEEQIAEMKTIRQAARKETKAKIHAILTDEQKEKFDTVRSEMKQRKGLSQLTGEESEL